MARQLSRTVGLGLAGLIMLAVTNASPADGMLRPRPTVCCPDSMPLPRVESPTLLPPVGVDDKASKEPAKVELKVDGKIAPKSPTPSEGEPRFEPLVSAALGDTSFPVGFTPAMFGDQFENGYIEVVVPPATPNIPNRPQRRIQAPRVSYAAFKIAENESPRPTDRVFATYGYFDRVAIHGTDTRFNGHRQVIGFEKTFCNERASVGLRAPALQLDGPRGTLDTFGMERQQFGDLTAIVKYAFIDDRATGDLMSLGIAVTAPTGDPANFPQGASVHSTLIQPFLGCIHNSGRWFMHGFTSIVAPTDSDDVTAWYNDLGVGFWLRRGQFDRCFHGIAPTLEVHVGTALSERGGDAVVRITDFVNLVGGVNFVFGTNSTIGLATGLPVTGPRPWAFETNASINFRF